MNYKRCQVCGAPTDDSPLCPQCYQRRENGEIIKYDFTYIDLNETKNCIICKSLVHEKLTSDGAHEFDIDAHETYKPRINTTLNGFLCPICNRQRMKLLIKHREMSNAEATNYYHNLKKWINRSDDYEISLSQLPRLVAIAEYQKNNFNDHSLSNIVKGDIRVIVNNKRVPSHFLQTNLQFLKNRWNTDNNSISKEIGFDLSNFEQSLAKGINPTLNEINTIADYFKVHKHYIVYYDMVKDEYNTFAKISPSNLIY